MIVMPYTAITIQSTDDDKPGVAYLSGPFVPKFVSCDNCGRPPGIRIAPGELMSCAQCGKPLTWADDAPDAT